MSRYNDSVHDDIKIQTSNVMIDEQSTDNVLKHIIAETLTFNYDSVKAIAECIAEKNNNLTLCEVERLTKMSILTNQAIAQKLLTNANLKMSTDPSGSLALTSIISELAIIKARAE